MAVLERAPWLEPHDQFEGIGAHELNPRYDHVDGGGYDTKLQFGKTATPALFRAEALLAAAPPHLDGHDGSHHQYDAGPVDLDALAAATWILWWKATQSTGYTDPTFLRVWARRQMWTHRHPYHWLSSTTDPEQQADHFVQITGDMIPGDNGMLDAEEAGITVAMCLGWCEYVEARRKRPQSIYSGLYVAGGSIWKSDKLRESKYGLRPFHVAAYVTWERLQQVIVQTGSQNYPLHAWQFSSNGPVPGITGRADMNRVDDHGVYDLACGLTSQPRPVEDNEMAIYPTNEAGTIWRYNDFTGEKRPLSWFEYHDLLGDPPTTLFTDDELGQLPDYKPASGATVGAAGPQGVAGPTGAPGATGPAGADGAAATGDVTGTFHGQVT